ncbi:hypothetical protein RFI_26993 [Reticulomyxa filosa]|uniref:Transmembrane protein n=1 Tax=Reticulomyxa filosa TaxID=46433 RepID=X6M9U2_RETFI|nr:hypothetical protein RFI_26993 [Reticulomyxa filosa]|eukprot:ETO10386.1 hypothetical protein RFI_26993 [Reticulomyxa filosa]
MNQFFRISKKKKKNKNCQTRRRKNAQSIFLLFSIQYFSNHSGTILFSFFLIEKNKKKLYKHTYMLTYIIDETSKEKKRIISKIQCLFFFWFICLLVCVYVQKMTNTFPCKTYTTPNINSRLLNTTAVPTRQACVL